MGTKSKAPLGQDDFWRQPLHFLTPWVSRGNEPIAIGTTQNFANRCCHERMNGEPPRGLMTNVLKHADDLWKIAWHFCTCPSLNSFVALHVPILNGPKLPRYDYRISSSIHELYVMVAWDMVKATSRLLLLVVRYKYWYYSNSTCMHYRYTIIW